MALVKKTPETVGTSVTLWEQELAAEAQAEAKSEKVSGNFFSFKGGKITFSGNDLGNSMDVVVAGSIYDRAYYPGAYGDAKSPDCYSYSKDGIGMVPHPEAPNKQSETCETCPLNKFGSALQGKGKACREYRKLALISADNLTSEEVPEAVIGIAKIPPTSNKAFGDYVRSVAELHKRPMWAMITEVKVLPDPQRQVSVSFKAAAPLAQDVAMAIKERAGAISDVLNAPYPVISNEPAKPVGKAKFAAKR